MDGINEVTSSGDGTPSAEINLWDLPVVVKETWGNEEPIASSSMSNTVLHLAIQKKFLRHKDFENAVASIQKGCCIDSIWHPCSNAIEKYAMGKDGSDLDPRVPISFQKFEQLQAKHELQGKYYVIHNCTPAKIISSEQQVEICYPLKFWLLGRKNSRTSTETKTMNVLNYHNLLLPIVFSHAHKLLGTGTRETLTEWKQYLELRNEELKTGMSMACLEQLHNGDPVAVYHFSTWELPLTQDPLTVVGYSFENLCDNTCDTFIRNELFDTDDWLYVFE